MRILNLCVDDWANFAFDNAMALRSVGIDAVCYKRNPHVSRYRKEGIVADIDVIISEIRKADVVQFFHDHAHFFSAITPYLKDKRVIAYHTSSVYRRDPEVINKVMNPIVESSVCAMPEFMKMGAKDAVYMVGAYDSASITPSYRNGKGGPYRFAHYPSNALVKGTRTIERLMRFYEKERKMDFSLSTEIVNNEQQLKRMNECDVYIELFSHVDAYGSPYGNFGITALEAAAMGKVVITNCLDIAVYEASYGECGLTVANTEKQFMAAVEEILTGTWFSLRVAQEETRLWMEEHHSYIATGECILKQLI